ncbi:hypothetical protein [Deinococcus humi]|uniref:M50 family peptidase n=1 Tax=Deinococcus humi TaxID=662880 RepID=A0A7W8JSZ5_9DEIO|nr:hypothetical protein [Deinococcus humi]MBB5362631.1 hypothetical protein [Deinococcus humi]GGO31316.1 hypothetical protein GCM10008949_27150 [Deinococcus humi]
MTPLQRRAARLAGLILALVLIVPGVLRPLQNYPLHLVNLIFHEVGHVLLRWAGETVTLLGGSLFQLLVPAACVATFLRRGDRYAAGIVALWLGQSFAGVAAYIRDAPARTLELITGAPDTHDWWQLLVGWDALNLAEPLARAVFFLALPPVIVGAALALWDDMR